MRETAHSPEIAIHTTAQVSTLKAVIAHPFGPVLSSLKHYRTQYVSTKECPLSLQCRIHRNTPGIPKLSPNAGNGGWSTWAQWTDCSVSCNDGTQTRRRACDSPTPAWGGLDCEGINEETRGCNLRPCPSKPSPLFWLSSLPTPSSVLSMPSFSVVDCVWYEWTEWEDCSLSCDGGTKARTRGWSSALYGGRECEGEAEEVLACNTQPCPGELLYPVMPSIG